MPPGVSEPIPSWLILSSTESSVSFLSLSNKAVVSMLSLSSELFETRSAIKATFVGPLTNAF